MAGQPKKPGKRRIKWLRILWIIFRNLLVPLLCACGLIAGLLIGYTRLGGQPAAEVFSMETWMHLFNLVFGN
jgi:hypothetical protein